VRFSLSFCLFSLYLILVGYKYTSLCPLQWLWQYWTTSISYWYQQHSPARKCTRAFKAIKWHTRSSCNCRVQAAPRCWQFPRLMLVLIGRGGLARDAMLQRQNWPAFNHLLRIFKILSRQHRRCCRDSLLVICRWAVSKEVFDAHFWRCAKMCAFYLLDEGVSALFHKDNKMQGCSKRSETISVFWSHHWTEKSKA